MDNSQDFLQQLIYVGAVLGAILVILKTLIDIYKSLKPFLGPVVVWGTIVVPYGLLIWYWMYIAVINSTRIGEKQVFISLIIQLTLLISIYTFCWGKWIYPKLKQWLEKQSINNQSQPQNNSEQKKDEN